MVETVRTIGPCGVEHVVRWSDRPVRCQLPDGHPGLHRDHNLTWDDSPIVVNPTSAG